MAFSVWNSNHVGVTTVPNWLVLLASVGALGFLLAILLGDHEPYGRFRRLGQPWYLSFLPSKPVNELVAQGYHESREPFVVRWWALDWLVLGPQYLPDLKHCESTSLSFFRVISDALHLNYSVDDLYHSEKMTDVIKKGMNTQLPALTPIVVEELEPAFERQFSKATGWQEVPVADAISDLTNQVACRVLICRELSRDEKFLRLSMKFQHSIFVHAMIIISFPFGPLRKLFSWVITLPHRRNLGKAIALLQPIVARRMVEKAQGKLKTKPNDGIEWTLDLTGDVDMDPYRVSLEVLHNLFAGSLAPGAMITEMIFQALTDAKLLEELRTEAKKALDSYGWTEKLLQKLYLQDSFIRELNRIHPTGSTGCSRLVVDKSFTFSDGITLPRGTRVTFPIQAIMNDSQGSLQNATQFDAYRFLHLRDGSSGEDGGGNDYQWSASSISSANLMFGYGKHACPGRYYCIRQAKLIFTKLLVEYDLEWPVAGIERPQREAMEGQFGPNRTQKMRIRRRAAQQ
ncbi:putative cytochrome P450 monooxygenase [Seiridium cardinale]|uniref:Cytochrome P450 monooxygenase n=1 Tax=Seiridium cardinale TaxID=138064 RepID=A0ABR2XFE7_9PEZI